MKTDNKGGGDITETKRNQAALPACISLIMTLAVLAVAGCADYTQGPRDEAPVTGEIQSGRHTAGVTITTGTIIAPSPQKVLPQAPVPPSSAAAATARIPDPSERAVPHGILIGGIRDITLGEPLVVSGRTSLPVGTSLTVKVVPVITDKEKIAGDFRNVEMSTVTKVVEGSTNGNRFSVTLETADLLPEDYIVSVSPRDDWAADNTGPSGINGSYAFAVIAR